MAKPTQTTEWCSDASYVEPSAGKKVVGFDPGERPPAQHLDWLFFTLELWIAWLDGIVAPGSGSESVSMSSAGDILANGAHGERSLHLDVLGINVEVNSGGDTIVRTAAGGFQVTTTIASTDDFTWTKHLPVKTGDRIRRINIPDTGGAGINWTFDVIRVRADSPYTVTVVATRTTFAQPMLLPAAGNIDHTVLDGWNYYLRAVKANPGGSPETVAIRDIALIYDRPV